MTVRHRRTARFAIPLAAALLIAAPPARGADDAARFTFRGFGPVQAGDSLAQAERALGQPLNAAAVPADPGTCHLRESASQPGVRYAIRDGVLTRAETRDPRYATASGIHVGDSLAQALKAYGRRATVTPHPYFDRGKTLTIYSPDRRFALVIESNDGGRILTLRGGRLPDVQWLEGCS